MTTETLEPRLSLLSEEYVLVQAWKKAAAYIRAHNWYADTLELDHAAVNLPQFIGELAARFRNHAHWSNDKLRIVPAPKTQQWHIDAATRKWQPRPSKTPKSVLRPLAHVSLQDQVAATAVLLCLADRVESAQGDPRADSSRPEVRGRVTSYGNRLFCDAQHHVLRHRWGAAKLYRAYYQDYRAFLARPELVADGIDASDATKIVVVHSDLRQFYDRVSPSLIAFRLAALYQPGDDLAFFDLAARVLNWGWHRRDVKEAAAYASGAGLEQFTEVALPQGLVAAGFFANIALLDFDEAVRSARNSEIATGIYLHDCCRYVDDLRLVLQVPTRVHIAEVEKTCGAWLQSQLDKQAPGLLVSEEKTTAAALRGDERPLVRQSRKLQRIQTAVSGGFDAIGGEEILDAVQGLIRSQQRYSERREESGWAMAPVADVRDATVARFAAQRFRTTYRSLRPLLAERDSNPKREGQDHDEEAPDRSRVARTQEDLDDEAKAFALGLLENWIQDPSNVRLLRVGLDLWPAVELLRSILGVLRPIIEKGGKRKVPRRVAWYCLSEIFRAGATETGFVEGDESLPAGVDIDAYRGELRQEAVRLCALPGTALPWYLRQQALLFLAANGPRGAIVRLGRSPETRRYTDLIRYLRGDGARMNGVDFASLAILARRAFVGRDAAIALVNPTLTPRRLEQIAERDPSFALEILVARPEFASQVSPRLRDDLCIGSIGGNNGNEVSLATLVLANRSQNQLRNELSLLLFATLFLQALPAGYEDPVTPSEVLLALGSDPLRPGRIEGIRLVRSRVAPTGSLYGAPSWCPVEDRWRFQLGFLLRFILTGREDFTKAVRPESWKESAEIYRGPESHWYQRTYGFFNGQSAFGDDWLPISDWVEDLLSALLAWPGCRPGQAGFVVENAQSTRAAIEKRIGQVTVGAASGALMVPIHARRLVSAEATRPLRVCVVQNVIPTPDDFSAMDLTLSDPQTRKRHRNHLAAALAAVDRMLDLRETHLGRHGRLDWLILPELSVHPRDVRSHLIPFARAHKTMIFAGITYQQLLTGGLLMNSAVWIIPQWTAAHGLQVLIRRQGKEHLAPEEQRLNLGGQVIGGFRPCQWLVGYEWTRTAGAEPLWLTGSVCYDATDLALTSDLRSRSDVFAISALNKDVTTFDQMAFALHYHMYQLVIVANNGAFGGSNAHAPFRDAHVRQVFHVHGQPQASVSFLELDDIAAFLRRKTDGGNLSAPPGAGGAGGARPPYTWKFPPAGL